MKMETMKKLLFSFFIFFINFAIITDAHPQNNQKPAVVFDLGGVLFDTDSAVVKNKQIGQFLAIRFALTHLCFSSKSFKQRWFAVLNNIARNNAHTFAFHNEDGTPIELKDEHGMILPSYLIEWMAGNRSNQEIFDEVVHGINALDNLSDTDKAFMIKLTKVFLPEFFVASRKPIEQMVILLGALKKQEYPLYVLSNWDKESFEKMVQTYPEIFTLFDGYIVSGIVHLAKPDPRIYKLLEQTFPHSAYILFDDQKDNIKATTSRGWKAIQVKNGLFDEKALFNSMQELSMNQSKQSTKLNHNGGYYEICS